MIYLDNAAATPVKREVIDIVMSTLECYGNPSSIHSAGVRAREILINATNIISQKIHCSPEEIYYTSGATMSNNVFIQGFLQANPNGALLISTVEHNDILDLAEYWKLKERKIFYIPVDNQGHIIIPQFINLLSTLTSDHNQVLCSIQMANNETGVIQDMDKLLQIAHSFPNVIIHTDATQYIPYYPIDLQTLSVDALSMSGQKIGSIKGTGLLFIRNGIHIDPIIFGEQGLIGGTENVIGIAALGKAFELLDYNNTKLIGLQKYLFNELSKYGTVIGDIDQRIPSNVYLLIKDVLAENVVSLLSEMGVCISAGSACNAGSAQPSRVVKAMGYSSEDAMSCIRISISNETTTSDIKNFLNTLDGLLQILQNK